MFVLADYEKRDSLQFMCEGTKNGPGRNEPAWAREKDSLRFDILPVYGEFVFEHNDIAAGAALGTSWPEEIFSDVNSGVFPLPPFLIQTRHEIKVFYCVHVQFGIIFVFLGAFWSAHVSFWTYPQIAFFRRRIRENRFFEGTGNAKDVWIRRK